MFTFTVSGPVEKPWKSYEDEMATWETPENKTELRPGSALPVPLKSRHRSSVGREGKMGGQNSCFGENFKIFEHDRRL